MRNLPSSVSVRAYELDLAVAKVLGRMRLPGLRVDIPLLQQGLQRLEQQRLAVQQRVDQLAGKPFNHGSTKQLADVLRRQGAPLLVRTQKGNVSVNKAVLKQLAPTSPVAAGILQERQLKEHMDEAHDAIAHHVREILHPNLQLAVIPTGRLACSKPNLLGLSKQPAAILREALIPALDDCYFLEVDLSQVEPRILASLADEPVLLDAFSRGIDVYRLVASQVLGVPFDRVTADQRALFKTLVLGLNYGLSPQGLAAKLGISTTEATRHHTAYFGQFPRIRAYITAAIMRATRQGYVETYLGRRRYLPGLKSPVDSVRRQAIRQVTNTVIQGTGASVLKLALVKLDRILPVYGAALTLPVHDAVLITVPNAVDPKVLLPVVAEAMDPKWPGFCPLTVEGKVGPNLKDLKPIQ